jgi:hypothetical protein
MGDGRDAVSDSDSSSESVGSVEPAETCQTVGRILIKTVVELECGLSLICLHHEHTLAPFLELDAQRMSLRYDMHYDHDLLEVSLASPVLSDLTEWPRTIDPRSFRKAAEAAS